MSLLAISQLTAAYDAGPVLHQLSLSIPQGAFVAVIGANTAGKSTLLRSISGLVPKIHGEILYAGKPLHKFAAHRIPELGIAHVPEGRHVFPEMSVAENLLLGAYTQRKDKALIERRIDEAYALFPRLRERQRQLAGTLSGGEQQMVAIARALMSSPKLLLLDEPSHGLAPKVVDELHETLLKIHESGVTMLLVEQNTTLALSVTSHAYVLQSGRIVLEGAWPELLADARIREAYLGI